MSALPCPVVITFASMHYPEKLLENQIMEKVYLMNINYVLMTLKHPLVQKGRQITSLINIYY